MKYENIMPDMLCEKFLEKENQLSKSINKETYSEVKFSTYSMTSINISMILFYYFMCTNSYFGLFTLIYTMIPYVWNAIN